MKTLFQQALGITDPWLIQSVEFNPQDQRLDIHIDFMRGPCVRIVVASNTFNSRTFHFDFF